MNKNNNYEGGYGTGSIKDMSGSVPSYIAEGLEDQAWNRDIEKQSVRG